MKNHVRQISVWTAQDPTKAQNIEDINISYDFFSWLFYSFWNFWSKTKWKQNFHLEGLTNLSPNSQGITKVPITLLHVYLYIYASLPLNMDSFSYFQFHETHCWLICPENHLQSTKIVFEEVSIWPSRLSGLLAKDAIKQVILTCSKTNLSFSSRSLL